MPYGINQKAPNIQKMEESELWQEQRKKQT